MAAAAPPNNGAAPPLARSTFQEVGGVAATHTEARWTLPRDSPIVNSLCFIDWSIPPAGRASAPRSQLVGAIIMACRAPTEAEQTNLAAKSFLTHEMDVQAASDYAHVLDSVQAFDDPFATVDEWIAIIPQAWGKMANNADGMRLLDAAFVETETYRGRQQQLPDEVAFLSSATLGGLAVADSFEDGIERGLLSLARATVLAESKDTRAVREDESSPLRLGAERIKALLLRSLHRATASAPGLAHAFT